MATSGIVNGTLLRFYDGDTALGHATSCTIDWSMEVREVLTKDSPGNGWVENYPGRKSGSGSFEGLVAYDTANRSIDDIFTKFTNRTPVVLLFTTGVTGDPNWEMSAYITSLGIGATVEDNVTYSGEFTFHGATTQSVEA